MGRDKKRKFPAFIEAPPNGKLPRVGVHDPSIEQMRKPSWRLQNVDLDGPWGWRNVAPEVFIQVLDALKNYETMNWPDIERRKSCHRWSIPDLPRDARKRLEELELDDTDGLFQLRVNSRMRVFGFLERNILKILWLDQDHSVCPIEPRNT